jgi:hypothetical protein
MFADYGDDAKGGAARRTHLRPELREKEDRSVEVEVAEREGNGGTTWCHPMMEGGATPCC